MKAQQTPKIFVSYSWTTPEHEDLVLELSRNLMGDGIDIKLDKWEIHEGDDPIAFMESMVNDETITKIIMIIDSEYSEKANNRKGGVGTESTILSNELYSKRDRNKIVAVIAEPGAKPPIFYAGRLHVDLSNQEKYADEYEKLVRWAFDQYKYEKPQNIGTPPSFITADESTEILHTNTEFRIALDAVEKGKPNASGNIKSYLSKLNAELKKLSISNEVKGDDVVDTFKKNIVAFQPHLLEFKKIIDATCSHTSDLKIHKHFRLYFEEFLEKHLTVPFNGTSRYKADIEFFEFILYQSFINYVAILLKHDAFNELTEILDELFIIPKEYHYRHTLDKHSNFTIFMPKETNIIHHTLKGNFQSPLGEMIGDQDYGLIISLNDVVEADIFLYIKSIAYSDKYKIRKLWQPYTGMLITQRPYGIRVFLKSEKESYFSDVMKVLGVNNLLFLEPFFQKDTWNFPYLDMKTITNFQKLTP